MKRNRGFTLIELLLVVAIIMVLVAISAPQFTRSRAAANEASAVASLRDISSAQVGYSQTYPALGFADDLTKLGYPSSGASLSPTAAGFIDWVLACPTQPCSKSGYSFAIQNTSGTPIYSYTATGVPLSVNNTGTKGYCVDDNGRITFDPAGGTNCTNTL